MSIFDKDNRWAPPKVEGQITEAVAREKLALVRTWADLQKTVGALFAAGYTPDGYDPVSVREQLVLAHYGQPFGESMIPPAILAVVRQMSAENLPGKKK